ncbi:PhoPQ-activated pathogenicity protein [Pseudomonas putida]|jgi:PhoPQ-activated pathogenicity-related protein|uniref:PhoPQ-activated pathogenicity protein n=1 Tax=Pseudomonas putida TaxID=303 RepID=A0A2S3XAQ8_PSEPU|nr:PhoPQ-activated protein PqaA family protein [Pseudomonas putida]POG01985.1 PhoPQ-activated pathogenicity protein [Pseudomonas putida]POG12651.1 PhoPQ-activated pathogenicity protein [Pseudomonas putida]
MKYRFALAIPCLMASFHASALQDCSGLRPQEVVHCHIGNVRQKPLEAVLLEQASEPGYDFRRLQMVSQVWDPVPVVEPRRWEHDVELHVPRNAVPGKALLVVNNGIRHGPAQSPDYTREALREVALKSHMAVVMISDAPNQYVTFGDVEKPLREDDAVAHTWAHSLRGAAPELPLHVPMAAAASRAMDLAVLELGKQGLTVDSFIITGASKRGWSAWLTALADERVMAIVPAVIDVADTSDMLAGLRKRYGGHWPLALGSYQQAGVLQQLGTPAFERLMALVDPMQYLNEEGQRLAIPKYLVSASGDDFFVPDPVTDYQQRLPGQTSLRVLPNSDHGGVRQQVVSTLVPAVTRLRDGKPLPSVQVSEGGQPGQMAVDFSEPPVAVRVWTASNSQDRDFRYACGVRYQSETLVPQQHFTLQRTAPATGWQAQFVEAKFADGFIATSPVSVLPQTYPAHQPTDHGGACRSFLAGGA